MFRLAFTIILLLPVFFTARNVSAEPSPVRDIAAYRQAAEGGNADAQYSLGLMYQNGAGVLKSATAECVITAFQHSFPRDMK